MGIGKSPEGMEPLTGSLLVELSILAPVGQDAVAEDLKAFAEQLKPLVNIERLDPRRFSPLS